MTLLDSPKAPRRAALLAQLEDEAAMGWPWPWWPQDQPNVLAAYISIVGDVVATGRRYAHDATRGTQPPSDTTEGAA